MIGSLINPEVTGMMIFALLVVSIWELVWKGIALWHSAQGKQKAWFVVILIFNTLGILSIVYLLWFRKYQTEKTVIKIEPVKRRKIVKRKVAKKKPVKRKR
jgi:hypothetical protein